MQTLLFIVNAVDLFTTEHLGETESTQARRSRWRAPINLWEAYRDWRSRVMCVSGNQMCAYQVLIPRRWGAGEGGSGADADIAYKKVADRSLLHPAIG